jgi:hypothetical protein
MPQIRRILITDNPFGAHPKPGETVVLLHGRSLAEAAEPVGAGPVEIRLDLEDPMRFLAQLASVPAAPGRRAA